MIDEQFSFIYSVAKLWVLVVSLTYDVCVMILVTVANHNRNIISKTHNQTSQVSL